MKKIYAALLVVLLTLISGSAFAQVLKQLRVSAIPDENPQEMLRIYQPFADYLSKEIGIPVKFTPVIDYAATAMSEDVTPNSLRFTLFTNDAEPERVVLDMEFGMNVIEDPERFIYDGGYIYLEVMALPPSTNILIKNISIEVSGSTADGSLITLTE